MAGIKIADITENVTRDAAIGNALLPMSLNGETFSVEVNDFFYPNVINATRLATNAINANHITSLTVLARHIQGNAITASKIKSGSITTKEISADTIDAIKVSAAQINVNSIVATVINSIEITSDNIAANTITANKIKSNQIDTNHIKSFAIDTNSLRANAITAGQIKSGTITANEISANTVAATNLKSGAVEARALAANIIMTGSLQSRNFDGYEGSLIDNNAILRSLDAGSQGFFLNEKTGAIICTDLIARNNIITANLINFSLSASSLEEVTGDNGEKSIQVALDDNTLARDPDTGRITISSKLTNTKGVFDKSLLLDPNTIFFGMSERQEFKLPTLGLARVPFSIWKGEGKGNMNPNTLFRDGVPGSSQVRNNPFHVGLSATYFRSPGLANSDNDGVYRYRQNDIIGGAAYGIHSGPTDSFRVAMYHPEDNRIKNLPFLGNNTFYETNIPPMQDDTLDLSVAGQSEYLSEASHRAVYGKPVLFALDFTQFVDSADVITGGVQLNNYKIKVDTSSYEKINDCTQYTWHEFQTVLVSNSASAADQYIRSTFTGRLRNKVNNPTILRDVYEYSVDGDLFSIDKGNLTRYAIVYFDGTKSNHIPHYSYPGHISLSAVFDTDTNLRFNVTGAVPATTRYDLSTINCLVPANYHPDNKEAPYNNPSQQKVYVSNAPTIETANRMVWEHDWFSDRPALEGFPEVDPGRINPANGLRGFDSVAATIQYFGAEAGDPQITFAVTDRNRPDQNLSHPGGV